MAVYWIPNLLVLLNAPRSQQNRDLLMSWWAWEGGNGGPKRNISPSAKFNWLNSTTKVLGSSDFNVDPGVQNYPTYLSGLYATNKTLRQDKYAGIRKALKSGHPLSLPNDPDLVAGLSTWVTGESTGPVGAAYAQRVLDLARAYEKV